MYSTSLASKVENFVSGINLGTRKSTFIGEIIRHVLRIPSILGKSGDVNATNLRSLAFELNCLEEFSFFKMMFLDVSYYLNRIFWLEVVKHYRDGATASAPVLEDIRYLEQFLLPEDFDAIKKINTNDRFNVDHIDLMTWETGRNQKRKLKAYVKSKVSVLRFVAKYDHGLSLDDFCQDLSAEVVRIMNIYRRSIAKNLPTDKEFDVDLEIQRYIESSLNYKVNGIKGYNKCESRRRVEASEELEVLYKERKKLAKKLAQMQPFGSELRKAWEKNKLDISVCQRTDFRSLTVPMKYYSGDEDSGHEREFCSEDLAVDASSNFSTFNPENPRDTLDNDLWVNKVIEKLQVAVERQQVNSRIISFVKVVTGRPSVELDNFNAWARENGVNTVNFTSMVNGAKKFCELKKSDLKNTYLRSVVLAHRGSDEVEDQVS